MPNKTKSKLPIQTFLHHKTIYFASNKNLLKSIMECGIMGKTEMCSKHGKKSFKAREHFLLLTIKKRIEKRKYFSKKSTRLYL